MQKRRIGSFESSAVAMGCMNPTHMYGPPMDRADAAALLNAALDMGYDHLDSAALYGFGASEELIGEAVGHRRGDYLLASKAGTFKNADGQREINGRPDVLKKTCEDALKRLRTEVIDLYYLHRWDKTVPIEDSIGALSDLVTEGKVRELGLSEVSAETLRKAHAVHPIVAVQTEYALWSRNAEIAVLDACREIGAAFVAFAPLGRGFLTGTVRDNKHFPPGDIRLNLPRFEDDHFAANLVWLQEFAGIAERIGCTMGQLALAWVLARGPHIVALPGTTRIAHLRENMAAEAVTLDAATIARLDALINRETVSGPRYRAATAAEVDTEDYV